MHANIEKILLEATGSSHVEHTELIQKLWSGYGELSRVRLNDKSVILKLIRFPTTQNHPRGWSSDLSHQRKVKSYQVEMSWYQNYNDKIDHVYIPRYLTSGKVEDLQYLVLEDLYEQDLKPKSEISWEQVKLCLSWLAGFHAKFLNQNPDSLWKVGTYWHLETRPDELNALKDLDLKKAAPLIDHKLTSAKFKTFVHGDAKLANFLFAPSRVAAVDYQYVGGGVGIKDVAYFLSSVYEEDELQTQEAKCLDHYFKELHLALKRHNLKNVASPLEDEWRTLYPYAWCDFYRFLCGWSPGHWKIHGYSESMKDAVLKCL